MRTAMILHAFTGDQHGCCPRNRRPNEILFTAQKDSGDSFSAIVPGAMQVRLLAPASRELTVIAVPRDGEVFRAQLARYDDDPPIHSGVYLASIFAVVFVPGDDEFTGTGLATVVIDEDLPAVPRPIHPPEGDIPS
ncbi:MAG: hypothetical protein SFV51_04925 [Bryobacteraceae bacterium]|nr:hypothetical protein [Bryobacteraceae bacterium]